MKKYKYTGPTSGATIKTKEKKSIEVIFHDGKDYELPEDNAYVKTLIARGHLKEILKQVQNDIPDDSKSNKGQESKITNKPEVNK